MTEQNNEYYVSGSALEKLISSELFETLPDQRQQDLYALVDKKLSNQIYRSEEKLIEDILTGSSLRHMEITKAETATIVESLKIV